MFKGINRRVRREDTEDTETPGYPAIPTPISSPIPKVTAAAANPKITCRNPENQTLLPVKRVIAEPIRNKPMELRTTLNIIAGIPLVKMNGITGMMAPMLNNTNE